MDKPEWLIGHQEPRLSVVPEGDAEFANTALEFVKWAGLDLYPWQNDLVRDMLLYGPDALWAVREILAIIARQNGKGESLVALELIYIYLVGAKSIMHSAHFLDTAMDARDRLWDVIESNSGLMSWWEDEYPGVPKPVLGNGKDAIKFPNGAKIYFRTRTKKTGRGLSFDLLIFDECFDLPNEVYAAMDATTSARPNSQTVFISSPVNIEEHFHGDVFSAKRWAALDGAPGVMLKEWSITDDDDPHDPESWAKANPSLVSEPRPGVQLSSLEAASHGARNSEVLLKAFLVERLGKGNWVPRDADVGTDFVPIFDISRWKSQEVSTLPVKGVGYSCIGIDVTPDGEKAGVVSAVEVDDKYFLSVSPVEDFDRDGVVESSVRAVEMNDPVGVVVDPSGQGSTLIAPFRAAGVDPEQASGSKVSIAYELLRRLFDEGRILHDGDSRWLEALNVAVERSRNGRFRSLERFGGDVTVLVAASLALWGLVELSPRSPEIEVKQKHKVIRGASGGTIPANPIKDERRHGVVKRPALVGSSFGKWDE